MATTGRGRLPPPLVAGRINQAYKGRERTEPVRTYIGASTIGHSCDAFLALCLRGFPEDTLDGKLQRIFKVGHAIEQLVVNDLRLAGFPVYDTNPKTGQQWRFTKYGDNVVCHADALMQLDDGTFCVAEIKSMNNFHFMNMKRQGLSVSHPKYIEQTQMLLGMSGYATAHLIAYNKDTSDYWSEEIGADPFVFSAQMARAERAMFSHPVRQTKDPDSLLCKKCFKRDACWFDKPVPKTCKTCIFSFVESDGSWSCRVTGKPATEVCEKWARWRPGEKP